MTKVEMITEITKATGFSKKNLDKAAIKRIADSVSKDRCEQIYNMFCQDKEHASYYLLVM